MICIRDCDNGDGAVELLSLGAWCPPKIVDAILPSFLLTFNVVGLDAYRSPLNICLNKPPNGRDDIFFSTDESKRETDGVLPALTKFFDGSMPLMDFKPEIDRLNKQNELWGFKGIKGQMFSI